MATIDSALVERLDAALQADLAKDGRLGKPKRYLAGDHDLPYMPRKAKKEYAELAKLATTNWTPLLSDTFAKGLFVDGYRPVKQEDNAKAWDYWQKNGLAARQSIAHRGALDYGTSYVLVLPGKAGEDAPAVPFIRPLDPLRTAAWYADEDDEFPEVGFRDKGASADGTRIAEIFDAVNVYTFTKATGDDAVWKLTTTEKHGLGVCPFVRFRDRLAGEATGIIRPIIPLQDRVNLIVFATLIAIQYASFRQRWATGLAIPEDEDGNPVEPFQAAVDRLWIAEDETARFGDFAQTELSGHHAAYDSAVATLAAISQINPNILTGSIENVSAEALAALQDTTQRKLGEYKTLFGESWELVFRLAARAAGDDAAADDASAEVRWRDMEAQSFGAKVDGLGKLATMLSIPAEGLWERVPGVTDAELQRWREAASADPLAELTRELTKQTSEASAAPAAPAESTGPDASETKAKADALGALIRAGVSPENAAAQVGMTGVEFTGAMPVSLRLPEAEAAQLEDA